MKDTDLQPILLKKAYDKGAHDWTAWEVEDFEDVEGDLEGDQVIRVTEQLHEKGLLKASIQRGPMGRIVAARFRITAEGIEAVEVGPKSLPSSVDQRQTVNISGSTGFQIGHHNTQTFQIQIESLIAGIDNSTGTPEEKEEAKGLLHKVLNNPIIASVAGGLAGVAGSFIK